MLLPLELSSLKSLSHELIKISMDAGARATLAGKTGQGQTYLPGGELPSNSPTQTNFVPKLASEDDLGEQARDFYIKNRGPAVAALKGAGGALLAGNLITGGRLGGHSGLARFGLRGFGLTGAGVGLADYYGQGKHEEAAVKVQNRINHRKASLPTAVKTANFISSTFTPARQLSEGLHTGSFEKIIHSGGRLRPPKVGQKFTFPGEMP